MSASKEIFELTVLQNNHSRIRTLKRQHGYPSHHGNKVWKSSLLLMDYLQAHPIEEGLRVLEIGCGWGLTGIYCAKHFKAKVTCLDLDATVFPYVDLHAEMNGVTVKTLCKPYQSLTGKALQSYDLIIGGDICFWDDLGPLLFNLVRRAQRNNVRSLLADPGRPPFTAMAERAQQKLQALFDVWFVSKPHNARGYILDVPSSRFLLEASL